MQEQISTRAQDIMVGIENSIQENPFNTSQGQVVTSESESYWARKLREGEFKTSYTFNTEYTDPPMDYIARSITPSVGNKALPIRLNFTVDSPCIIKIRYRLGNAEATDTYESIRLFAGERFTYDFPEGLEILSSGGGALLVYMEGSGTINYGASISYVEVTE